MRVNGRSQVIEPQVHDAEILSVSLAGSGSNRNVLLRLKTESGKQIEMEMRGVLAFVSNGFCLQNVILDVSIYIGKDCGSELLAAADDLVITADFAKEAALQVVAGKLNFVVVTPSVGCEIVCLAREVTFA